MATAEDEIRDLKEKNNELVQKVQYWKVAASARDNEKLELMKEINELRLKLGRLRSGGAAQARKLDAALQSASEEALSHLVQASSAVARMLELAKTYMQDRQDLDNVSPRWSAIGGTPKTERIHRVPPMMMGGQSIQPVVSLSRTILNASNSLSTSRNSNQNHSITQRAVPMHMLQDVYIPLRRIDASDFPGINMEIEMEANNEDDSSEELGLEDSAERSGDDSQNMSEGDNFDASRRLDAVIEDSEPEVDGRLTPPSRSRAENPLEGPSWLLDRPTTSRSRPKSVTSRTLEPDSTTEPEGNASTLPPHTPITETESSPAAAPAFSPTVRRRKRASSPPSLSPLAPGRFGNRTATARRNSNSGRILKVLVAKMRLDSADDNDEVSPPKRASLSSLSSSLSLSSPRAPSPSKRPMRFDAPSPNGATDAGVIVSEDTTQDRPDNRVWSEPVRVTARRDSRHGSHDSRKAQNRLANVEVRDGRLTNTDTSNRTDSRLANENVKVENAVNNVGDRRGNIGDRRGSIADGCGSAGDSDDSHEQNIEDNRGCVGDRQSRLGNCTGDDHSKTVGDKRFVDSRVGSVADGHSSRLDSVGDASSRFGSMGIDRDSDSSNEKVGEGRTRRPRKAVTYKEKPLNRKMRR